MDNNEGTAKKNNNIRNAVLKTIIEHTKIILQGSIEGKRRRSRPKMQWQDNIVKWNGLDINKAMRAAENREGWNFFLIKSTAPLRHPHSMG